MQYMLLQYSAAVTATITTTTTTTHEVKATIFKTNDLMSAADQLK